MLTNTGSDNYTFLGHTLCLISLVCLPILVCAQEQLDKEYFYQARGITENADTLYTLDNGYTIYGVEFPEYFDYDSEEHRMIIIDGFMDQDEYNDWEGDVDPEQEEFEEIRPAPLNIDKWGIISPKFMALLPRFDTIIPLNNKRFLLNNGPIWVVDSSFRVEKVYRDINDVKAFSNGYIVHSYDEVTVDLVPGMDYSTAFLAYWNWMENERYGLFNRAFREVIPRKYKLILDLSNFVPETYSEELFADPIDVVVRQYPGFGYESIEQVREVSALMLYSEDKGYGFMDPSTFEWLHEMKLDSIYISKSYVLAGKDGGLSLLDTKSLQKLTKSTFDEIDVDTMTAKKEGVLFDLVPNKKGILKAKKKRAD